MFSPLAIFISCRLMALDLSEYSIELLWNFYEEFVNIV